MALCVGEGTRPQFQDDLVDGLIDWVVGHRAFRAASLSVAESKQWEKLQKFPDRGSTKSGPFQLKEVERFGL